MAHRGIDRLCMTRGRPVAAAIVRRTKMGATLHDFARNSNVRLARIVAFVLARASRIFWDAARACRDRDVSGYVPIGSPFPDIADHIVKTVAIRREGPYRRRSLI